MVLHPEMKVLWIRDQQGLRKDIEVQALRCAQEVVLQGQFPRLAEDLMQQEQVLR